MHTISESLQVALQRYKIQWLPQDISIRNLFRDWQEGRLDLQPAYQRGGEIWSRAKKVDWIQSLLAGFPTMPIFLVKTPEGVEVIDGQQRLRAAFEFKMGEYIDGGRFILKGCRLFPDLSGLSFQDFPTILRNRIDEYTLRACTLEHNTSDELKHLLFVELNKDPSTLSRQELRNGSFVGPFSMALKDKFQHNKTFRRLIGKSRVIKWNRMEGAEWALRFLALHTLGWEAYNHKTYHTYLDNMLRDFRNASDQQLQSFAQVWDGTLGLVDLLWGDHAFRRFSVSFNIKRVLEYPNRITQGRWVPKPTVAMFDTEMLGLSVFKPEDVMERKDIIREELLYLMVSDHKFRDSLSGGTGSQVHIDRRVTTFRRAIEEIVGEPVAADSFTMQRKRDLLGQSPICQICERRIDEIDDAVTMTYSDWKRYGRILTMSDHFSHRFCMVMDANEAALPRNIIRFQSQQIA